MVDFIEIKHNDHCYVCNVGHDCNTRHKDVINYNGKEGYLRICHDCLGQIVKDAEQTNGVKYFASVKKR